MSNAANSSNVKDVTQNPATGVDCPSRSDKDVGKDPLHSATGWVTKRDRHMQLINSSVFDKETPMRNKAIDETRRQKALYKDQRERYKINKHLRGIATHAGRPSTTPTATTAPIVHEISVEGLRFHVTDGGSKLARIRGEIKSFG